MTNLPPFYVGQRVVALITIVKPYISLVKGTEYIVLDLYQCQICKEWNVGFARFIKDATVRKLTCCTKDYNAPPYYYAGATRFAPITENFQSISLEKVLETETPLISVN